MLIDNMENSNNWHAIFVVTGKEEKVKERLKYKLPEHYKLFSPKRKLKIRRNGNWIFESRPLFPGYVLMKGDIDANVYYLLKNIPDMIKVLKTGNFISRIADSEIKVLSRLIINSDEIGISNILTVDNKVKVIDGPLFELEGIIQSIDYRKGRAKIKLDFMGERRFVDLGINVLKPV